MAHAVTKPSQYTRRAYTDLPYLHAFTHNGAADAFVTKLLSYSSYGRFCEAQRGLALELLAEPQVAEEPECVEMKEM